MNITKPKKLLIIGVVMALAVIGIYVSLQRLQPSATGSTSVAPINSVSLAVGNPAPDFSVQTIDGQQFSLAAHKGKPVIIFAMFSGCGECILVGQTLNQIQKDYATKGVTVVAIDILNGESTSTLQQYRDYIKADFPLVSYNAPVVSAYNLTAPEITYVIDKDGNIAFINQGALNYQQYKDELDKII